MCRLHCSAPASPSLDQPLSLCIAEALQRRDVKTNESHKKRQAVAAPWLPLANKQNFWQQTKVRARPISAFLCPHRFRPRPWRTEAMLSIKNYLQQLPSSSMKAGLLPKLPKRDGSRQLRQRGVDFSIRLSAALVFRGKPSSQSQGIRMNGNVNDIHYQCI